ncbi:MAG: RNA methyltransferase [Desulfurococcus sp.]|nr:RNA methyltransferase [Desulfurococcus sp.]
MSRKVIRVVLVGIEGSVNLGVIARTCVNFNVDELYLVNPVASVQEALVYAAKARDFLSKAVVTTRLEDALRNVDLVVATSDEGFSERDMLRQSLSLEEFARSVYPKAKSVAILFGRESTGLTREELSKADILVTIPANPAYPTLNVSQAVAVVLWELWRQRRLQATNVPRTASRSMLAELVELATDVSRLVMSSEEKIERSRLLWKRMLSKSLLTEKEASLLKYWLYRVKRRLAPSSSI